LKHRATTEKRLCHLFFFFVEKRFRKTIFNRAPPLCSFLYFCSVVEFICVFIAEFSYVFYLSVDSKGS